MSLLGKQGWKFLNDPSSLVKRILKANIYIDEVSWKPISIIIQAILGGTYRVPKILLNLDLDGMLVMVPK
jgi:hypothetical protein